MLKAVAWGIITIEHHHFGDMGNGSPQVHHIGFTAIFIWGDTTIPETA